MIIYLYYLFIINVVHLNSDIAETSSIRSRAVKNDLFPYLGSKTDLSKKDGNSLKIISDEPFIIQLATAHSSIDKKKKEFEKEKKDAANKRQLSKTAKKRIPKLKSVRKRHRIRRDAHATGSKGTKVFAHKNVKKLDAKPEPVADSLSIDKITDPATRLENLVSRQKMFEAIDDALKIKGKKPKKKDEPFSWETTISGEDSNENEGFMDWVKKTDTDKTKYNPRFRSLLPDSPMVGMANPLTIKKTDKLHPLSSNLERLDRKINNIKKLLGADDSEPGHVIDGVRVRRKTELDRSANKIAKMFLTLSAINGKRKAKCKEDDYDDYDDYDDEKNTLMKRTPLSNNEERYKVKKWIEHLKSRRSNKYCPCKGYNGGEEDVFPLEDKVSKAPMMHEVESGSEESGESEARRDKGFFSRYGYHPRPINGHNRNRYAKINSDIDEKLKALKNRGKKLDLPLDDLEVYRSRAKKILQNAEDILDKIKEEEEKRSAKPEYLMNRLKELTSRIHASPRNNDNNDFMRLIQKNLGLDALHKVHAEEDSESLADTIKAYFTDPYEKAKELTEESAKQLSTFMLQNLAKLGGNDENVKEESKGSDGETKTKGRAPQSKGKYVPNGLINGKSYNPALESDKKDTENSEKSKQALEEAKQKLMGRKDIGESLKKVIDDMLKEQQDQVNKLTETPRNMEENDYVELENMPNYRPNLREQVMKMKGVDSNDGEETYDDPKLSKLAALDNENYQELENLQKKIGDLWKKEEALEKSLKPYETTESGLKNNDDALTGTTPEIENQSGQVKESSSPWDHTQNYKYNDDGSRGTAGKRPEEDLTNNLKNPFDKKQVSGSDELKEMIRKPKLETSLNENNLAPSQNDNENTPKLVKNQNPTWVMGKNQGQKGDLEELNKPTDDIKLNERKNILGKQTEKFEKPNVDAEKLKKINPLRKIGKTGNFDEATNQGDLQTMPGGEKNKPVIGNIQKIGKKQPFRPRKGDEADRMTPKTTNLRKMKNKSQAQDLDDDGENDDVTGPESMQRMTTEEGKSEKDDLFISQKTPEMMENEQENVNFRENDRPDNIVQWVLKKKEENEPLTSDPKEDAVKYEFNDPKGSNNEKFKNDQMIGEKENKYSGFRGDQVDESEMEPSENVQMMNGETREKSFTSMENPYGISGTKKDIKDTTPENPEDAEWEKIDDRIIEENEKNQRMTTGEDFETSEEDGMVEKSFTETDQIPKAIKGTEEEGKTKQIERDENVEILDDSTERVNSMDDEKVQKPMNEPNFDLMKNKTPESEIDDSFLMKKPRGQEKGEEVTNPKEYEIVRRSEDDPLKSADLTKYDVTDGSLEENVQSIREEKPDGAEELTHDVNNDYPSNKYEKIRKMMDESVRDDAGTRSEETEKIPEEENLRSTLREMEKTRDESDERLDDKNTREGDDENVQKILNDDVEVGNIQQDDSIEQYDENVKYDNEKIGKMIDESLRDSDLREIDTKKNDQIDSEPDENVQASIQDMKEVEKPVDSRELDIQSSKEESDIVAMNQKSDVENKNQEYDKDQMTARSNEKEMKTKMDRNRSDEFKPENETDERRIIEDEDENDFLKSQQDKSDERVESESHGTLMGRPQTRKEKFLTESDDSNESEVDDYVESINQEVPRGRDGIKPTAMIDEGQEKKTSKSDGEEMLEKVLGSHETATSTENEFDNQEENLPMAREENQRNLMNNLEKVSMIKDEVQDEKVQKNTDGLKSQLGKPQTRKEKFLTESDNSNENEADDYVESINPEVPRGRDGTKPTAMIDEDQEQKISNPNGEEILEKAVGSHEVATSTENELYSQEENLAMIRKEENQRNLMNDLEKVSMIKDEVQDEKVQKIRDDLTPETSTEMSDKDSEGTISNDYDETVGSASKPDMMESTEDRESEKLSNPMANEEKTDRYDEEQATDPERVKMERIMDDLEKTLGGEDDFDREKDESVQMTKNGKDYFPGSSTENLENDHEQGGTDKSIEKEDQEQDEDRVSLRKTTTNDDVDNESDENRPEDADQLENSDEKVQRVLNAEIDGDETDAGEQDGMVEKTMNEGEETKLEEKPKTNENQNSDGDSMSSEIDNKPNAMDDQEMTASTKQEMLTNDKMSVDDDDEEPDRDEDIVEKIMNKDETQEGKVEEMEKFQKITEEPPQTSIESAESHEVGPTTHDTAQKITNINEDENEMENVKMNNPHIEDIENLDEERVQKNKDLKEPENIDEIILSNSPLNEKNGEIAEEIIDSKENEVLGKPSEIRNEPAEMTDDDNNMSLSEEVEMLQSSHKDGHDSDQNDNSNEIGGASREIIRNPVPDDVPEEMLQESQGGETDEDTEKGTTLREDASGEQIPVEKTHTPYSEDMVRSENSKEESAIETSPEDETIRIKNPQNELYDDSRSLSSDDSKDWPLLQSQDGRKLQDIEKILGEILHSENPEEENSNGAIKPEEDGSEQIRMGNPEKGTQTDDEPMLKTRQDEGSTESGEEMRKPHSFLRPGHHGDWPPKKPKEQNLDDGGEGGGTKKNQQWARHPYDDETMRYDDDDPLLATEDVPADYDLDTSKENYPKLQAVKSKPFSSSDEDKLQDVDHKPKSQKLKMPTAIEKIMNDLSEGKEKDDLSSLQSLDPVKIDHFIDKIDEAETENFNHNLETDCRKECACADEIDSRSRKIGRYEIVKDFLHWVKDLRMNRVLSDD